MKVPAVWFAMVLILLAIPMALRKVPPNGFYGFRVPKTRSSPKIWYDANQKAGVNLLVACVLMLLVTGIVAAKAGAAQASTAATPILGALVVISLLVSFVQLHRM